MAPALDRSRPLRLVAVKYDGRVHWETVPCYPVLERDGLVVVGYDGDHDFIHHTRGVHLRGELRIRGLGFFWADRWYNVFYNRGIHPERGPFAYFYCNVALPPEREPGALRFCDLDVDVTWRAGEEPFVEDEDEFAAHAERFGYPRAIRERVPAVARRLLDDMRRRRFPFDGAAEALWASCFGDGG